MKNAKRRRSGKRASPREEEASSILAGKQTISQDNHDSNVGQRADRSEPYEIHPDDFEYG